MRYVVVLSSTIALIIAGCQTNKSQSDKPVKVVVVTGGHDFQQKEFIQMFDSFKGIKYTHKPQADDSEIFEDINNWPYDVIVLYNMSQKISPQRQQNFLKLLDKGVGLVAVHHAIAAFQGWPEYGKIIGGKYFLSERVENGVSHRRSDYKEGLNFRIHIEDKNHPITSGLIDFIVNDETYQYYFVDPSVKALLTTDSPTSEKIIGWISSYRKARICYIQPGHGAPAYANPNYRRLLTQAIVWSAD
jgi:uncharacterized protein